MLLMIQNNPRCHSREIHNPVGVGLVPTRFGQTQFGQAQDLPLQKNYRSLGFSLLEIMIAMALGVMITLGLSKLYLSMKQSYTVQTDMARLQEDGRLAAFILTKNIRMAGYSGCRSGRIADAIHGYKAENPPSDLKNITPNTDVIVIKKADVGITKLTQDVNAPANVIYVQENPAGKKGDKLLISDCEATQDFTTDSLGEKSIKPDNITITHNYKIADTEVARDEIIYYFIRKTSRKDVRGKPIYALYNKIDTKRVQELIPGISNMQIKYAVGGDYYTAHQVTNWSQVKGVYMTLTIQSGEYVKPWKMYIALRQRAAQF